MKMMSLPATRISVSRSMSQPATASGVFSLQDKAPQGLNIQVHSEPHNLIIIVTPDSHARGKSTTKQASVAHCSCTAPTLSVWQRLENRDGRHVHAVEVC